MTSESVSFSVVIPAYNEARRLDASLGEICAWLSGRGESAEVLVVDDGSADATADVVERCQSGVIPVRLLRHERNRGKGAAVRTGVLASRGELILVSDADLSTPIAEAEKLLPLMDEADVAIGSRTAPGAELRRPQGRPRQLLGKAFNRLLRAAGLTTFRDTQCGFKLWRRDAAQRVFAACRIDGFAFDVEALLLAEKAGFRIAETGVVWINSPKSRVRMLRDSLAMFLAVLGLRLRMSRSGSANGEGAATP
jgi:dolichyl-phosphate beta-glucosyltransferase